ncbi:hypothetical protein C4D60_Mb04t28070 [Musa balbisiana]|uniref:Uncharacterized protein n=1 Tax=Musa balbisiana TaxID=52838 RepID=A0A4S8KFD3_MUSBA|nr:hypothetical protein C4D60_Mb04t28070 [Musa balbisiana]
MGQKVMLGCPHGPAPFALNLVSESSQEVVATKVSSSSSSSSSSLPKSYSPAPLCSFESFGRFLFCDAFCLNGQTSTKLDCKRLEVKDIMLHMNNGFSSTKPKILFRKTFITWWRQDVQVMLFDTHRSENF